MARCGSAIRVWAGAVLLGLAGSPADQAVRAQGVLASVHEQAAPDRARQSASRTARLTVRVPHDDTELSLDGRVIAGTGTTREVDAPAPGSTGPQSVVLTATWKPNGYTTMTRTKSVSLRAGDRLTVDLTREDPGDRVRVIYVPTPADVAAEMVRLAAVTAADVVFEPGCGDARITIAAIKAGAKRAICVDLDPERAEESRANVTQAGLADRIDVRQGDALDVKDLSEVTVVFLYMGDHFNQLIRPVLWRTLAPGARIVSHRFTMGDWQPDRTVTVQSDDGGGTYDLHLWTVTEEIKRKAAR
jgi:uncharacterized protein (TIGR03000 family)